MTRAGATVGTDASFPGRYWFILEDIVTQPGVGDETCGFSGLREVLSAVVNLMGSDSPNGLIMVQEGRYSLHRHWLGAYGCMVCGFPLSEGGAMFRSYARGLGLLTNGRVRLVTHGGFPPDPEPDQILFEGSVETPQQAGALLARFRKVLTGQVPPRQALLHQLVFAELTANTLRYGRHGRMVLYEEAESFSIMAKDQGPGIPLERLPSSLLLTGHTTTPRSLGAGLPLIIRLAETVTVASGDQGTWILVRLPPTQTEVK